MDDNSPTQRAYQRPPMLRGLDPMRVNWLWQLFCEVGDIRPAEVHAALRAVGIPVTEDRVAAWFNPDTHDNYFPITIAEMERNLRTLLVVRNRVGREPASSVQAPQA
jgi:hypothetical protein